MKFFLVIFTIAMVAQVSFGAAIQRAKRDAVERDVVTPLKEVMPEIKSLIANTVKDIPDTDAYAKYKKPLVELLEMFDAEGDIMCVENIASIFMKIIDIDEKNDESEKAKEISALFKKHNTEDFIAKMKNIKELMDGPNNFETLQFCDPEFNEAK